MRPKPRGLCLNHYRRKAPWVSSHRGVFLRSNNTQVLVKEFSGQRTGNPPPLGMGSVNEGEDFFMLDQPSEIRTLGIQRPPALKSPSE